MGGWSRIWHELTKERTLPNRARRARREGRSSRAGVALLLVISIVALLTVVVTEVVGTAGVRIQLASHQRDEAKAEALAHGGIQFYRLLLIASQQFEGAVAAAANMGLPIDPNATQLWQILPSIDSGLIRMLVFSGGDEDEAAAMMQAGGLTEQQRAEADGQIQTSLRKSFLDFDGDFNAKVVDEERRIWVRKFNATDMNTLQQDHHARLLASMMSSEENDEYLRSRDLERWELIGDLADWTDIDDARIWDGSRESAQYERMDLEEPYLPKNTDFDTVDEIRLVNGWNRDNIWQRFGQHLTIYGSGKINFNTAEPAVLRSLMQQFLVNNSDYQVDWVMQQLNQCRNRPVLDGGCSFRQPQDVGGWLQLLVGEQGYDPDITNAITTKSTTYRVTSTGSVGQSKVSIEAVFQFPPNNFAGQVVYWRIE
jgi:type II secretory pathway component PulK